MNTTPTILAPFSANTPRVYIPPNAKDLTPRQKDVHAPCMSVEDRFYVVKTPIIGAPRVEMRLFAISYISENAEEIPINAFFCDLGIPVASSRPRTLTL